MVPGPRRARAVLEPGPGTRAELVLGAEEEEAGSVSCLLRPFLAPLVRGLNEAELSLDPPPPPPLLFLVFLVLTIVNCIFPLWVSHVIFGNNTEEWFSRNQHISVMLLHSYIVKII